MKIAVTYAGGFVYPHFGHTAQFKLYTAEKETILHEEVVDTAGSGHSLLADCLARQGVSALICGGIGSSAREALEEAGIAVYGGVHGDADEAVRAFLDGVLDYDPTARCSHHDCGGHCG